jgi:GNAT superfamily N-acetyltransferase
VSADFNNILRLDKSHIKPATRVLARAFQDYPLFVHLIPDESERKNKLSYILEAFVRYGILYGEVYASSPNLEGVAVWWSPQLTILIPWRMIRSGMLSILFKLGKNPVARLLLVTYHMSRIHRRHAPPRYWLLHIIGVAPDFQGKGYAATLLRPMLARIDGEQLPCYLDTEDEKNVPLYQHYGFKICEEAIIPRTEVRLWAMLRENSGFK